MIQQRVKAFIVLVLTLLAFAGAQAWRPTMHLSDTRPKVELETLIPPAFGEWEVDNRMPVQLVSPDTQAMLNKIYNQTLSRTYVNLKGDRIMLSVAYGGDQSDGTRAHNPEVCYPAQGFQISSRHEGTFSIGNQKLRVRQLVAQQGNRVEPISYWIMIGDHVTLSGTELKLVQLSYSTRGVIPDGMLMRISSIEPNAAKAYLVHQDFVVQLSKAVKSDLLAQVIGKNGA